MNEQNNKLAYHYFNFFFTAEPSLRHTANTHTKTGNVVNVTEMSWENAASL